MTTLQEISKGVKANIFVFLWVFFIFLVGIFFTFKEVKTNDKQQEKFFELYEKSEAHKVLLSSYHSCKTKFFSGTRHECVILMKQYSEIENMEHEFEQVFFDLKQFHITVKGE